MTSLRILLGHVRMIFPDAVGVFAGYRLSEIDLQSPVLREGIALSTVSRANYLGGSARLTGESLNDHLADH